MITANELLCLCYSARATKEKPSGLVDLADRCVCDREVELTTAAMKGRKYCDFEDNITQQEKELIQRILTLSPFNSLEGSTGIVIEATKKGIRYQWEGVKAVPL